MKKKVHLVPTFHYDLAYLMSFEEYFPRLKYIFTEMLNLMEKFSDYKFMFEQAILLDLFKKLCPEHTRKLKTLISSGRLEVTGFYVQTDTNIPCGESLIRNAILAKKLVKEMGGEARVAWMGDVFGLNAQIPQIAKLCGYEYIAFSRGLKEHIKHSEFIWESLDGTRMLTHYGKYSGVQFVKQIRLNLERIREILDRRIPAATTSNVLLPSGGDWAIPSQSAPEAIREWNKLNEDIKISFSTTTNFFDSVSAEKPKLQVLKKEMNPVLQGCYGSRIELKRRNREVETKLINAEKLSAIKFIIGGSYPRDKLEKAWRKILLNQFHDVICGTCVDKVFEQAIQWYRESSEIAEEIITSSLDFLTQHIVDVEDTEDKLIIVFNPLSFDRKDIVKLRITIAKPHVKGLRVFDENGKEIPVQLVDKVYYGSPPPPYLPIKKYPQYEKIEGLDEEVPYASSNHAQSETSANLREATLIFVAEIPALGYRIFRIKETDEEILYPTNIKVEEETIENEFYRVTFNRDGTIRSLIDKRNNLEFINPKYPFANNLLLQIDRGDLYTILPLVNNKDPPPYKLYDLVMNLFRGRKTIEDLTTGERCLLERIKSGTEDLKLWGFVESRNAVTKVEIIEKGPVRATVKVEGTMRFWTGINVYFIKYIHIYNDIPRIDFETFLLPKGRNYRIRVCFPVNVRKGTIRHEIPFGHVERPEGEYPAQNWIDYSDEEKGLCIINCGLPGNNVADDVAMITLMRSVAFEYKGESWKGFEEGTPHIFRYSIIPFIKGDPEYRPYIHGLEVNAPLIPRVVIRNSSHVLGKRIKLPSSFSFLKIEPLNIVLSAMIVDKECLILRVYEAEGKASECAIKIKGKVEKAIEEDCIGNRIKRLKVIDHKTHSIIKVRLKPFEIKTIRLCLVRGSLKT